MFRALHSYMPVLYAYHQINWQAVTMVVLYTVGGLEIRLRPTVYWTTDYDQILLSRAATENVSWRKKKKKNVYYGK